MQEALINLLILIENEIVIPLQNAFNQTSWVPTLLNNLNKWINSIFNLFREVDTQTEILFLTASFVSQILSVLILVWFSSLLVKIFKLSFLTLKKVYLSIVEVGPIEKGSAKTWRKQWRRKK